MIKVFHFLWIVPFVSFLSGYYLLHSIFYVGEVSIPNIIGKSLNEGVGILSDVSLNLRLLKEKEVDLPEGIILDQSPSPGKTIRPNTNIFTIISKKPKQALTPDFVGMKTGDVVHSAVGQGISSKVFSLPTPHSSGTCFAQHPTSSSILNNQNVVIYVSSPIDPLCIVPEFKGLQIHDIQRKLGNNIQVEVVHQPLQPEKHKCKKCVVVEQRPMAGSIIDGSKKLYLQLLVEKKV